MWIWSASPENSRIRISSRSRIRCKTFCIVPSNGFGDSLSSVGYNQHQMDVDIVGAVSTVTKISHKMPQRVERIVVKPSNGFGDSLSSVGYNQHQMDVDIVGAVSTVTKISHKMPQRVERIVVKPGHTHYDVCHRLCSVARKLGNQAVGAVSTVTKISHKMPQRVERIVVKPGHTHYDVCHRLCSVARKLGNQAVYIQRQKIFAKEPWLNRVKLDQAVRLTSAELYKSMPSAASAQRQTQIIHEQFVSWHEAKKAFLADPSKFKAMPRLPGYSKKYRTFVVGRNGYKIVDGELILTDKKKVGFPALKIRSCDNQPFNAKTNETVIGDVRRNGYKIVDGELILTDKKKVGFPALKIRSCDNQPFNAKTNETVIGDVRIVPHGNAFFIELTYKVNCSTTVLLDGSRACLVDIGLKTNETVIGDVRIVPHGNAFFIELTYKVNCSTTVLLDGSRACLVDIGLRNIVTLASTASGIRPVVVKGGKLKSINAMYNKDVASLQSHDKKAHRLTKIMKRTCRINDVMHKVSHYVVQSCLRNDLGTIIIGHNEGWKQNILTKIMKRTCRINDVMHKVSHYVVQSCLRNDLGTIIIGHNEGWKQNINLGKVNNQNFVYIPFNLLIQMIRYKAEAYGIKVIVRHAQSFSLRCAVLSS